MNSITKTVLTAIIALLAIGAVRGMPYGRHTPSEVRDVEELRETMRHAILEEVVAYGDSGEWNAPSLETVEVRTRLGREMKACMNATTREGFAWGDSVTNPLWDEVWDRLGKPTQANLEVVTALLPVVRDRTQEWLDLYPSVVRKHCTERVRRLSGMEDFEDFGTDMMHAFDRLSSEVNGFATWLLGQRYEIDSEGYVLFEHDHQIETFDTYWANITLLSTEIIGVVDDQLGLGGI